MQRPKSTYGRSMGSRSPSPTEKHPYGHVLLLQNTSPHPTGRSSPLPTRAPASASLEEQSTSALNSTDNRPLSATGGLPNILLQQLQHTLNDPRDSLVVEATEEHVGAHPGRRLGKYCSGVPSKVVFLTPLENSQMFSTCRFCTNARVPATTAHERPLENRQVSPPGSKVHKSTYAMDSHSRDSIAR